MAKKKEAKKPTKKTAAKPKARKELAPEDLAQVSGGAVDAFNKRNVKIDFLKLR
jgi:hypothetical protein